MKSTFTKLILTGLLAFLPHTAIHAESALVENSLNDVLTSPHRDATNVARDQYRHPAATLAFFGLDDAMQVAEMWPGRGWYTEILAPWLKQGGGQLIAAGFPTSGGPQYWQSIRKGYTEMLQSQPKTYDEVTVTEFGPGLTDFAPQGSLDAIVTFRNVHNWAQDGFADHAFNAMFKALKPDGILGVIEHRAQPDSPAANTLKSGYLTEKYVIEAAEQAGFVLEATSEINANPADTTNHPNGVWSLLPNLRVDEADKAQYREIGESDRMTLRFIKPAE